VSSRLSLIGIELVVADLERSLELLCDILGFDLLHRGPSEHVTGEMATVDTGGIVITLLAPAASGEGTVLAERAPRLGQLVIGADAAGEVAEALDRTVRAGLSAVPAEGARFHITPETIEGALGQPVAVVVTTVPPQ
jgi:catechol 2,3-dioxygenase-like lactoylglutathione lyase family enzyme